MLTTLRIRNLALVADLTLELEPGCNIITGETGAGKSIIIGALNLVLGERADRTLIRAGADACSVEALFDIRRLRAPVADFLEENGLEPCEDQQLVLKRMFTAAGTNRQFINGSPTTLSTLAALGAWLVDMHGPHEHQSLLQPSRQLAILDAFGKLESRRNEFAALVRDRARLESEKAGLIVDERTYAQQLDLLRFQAREIQGARLLPGEDDEIEAEYKRASNAAHLLELAQSAQAILSENEGSLLTQAGAVGRALQELDRIDASARGLLQAHEQGVSAWRDLQAGLSRYLDSIEIDPARLHEIEERLNLLHTLKRKYGSSITDVIAFGDDAQRKLEALEQRDAELVRLNAALQKNAAEIMSAGQALSAERRKLIPRLSKAVMKELAALGFKQSQFTVALETVAALAPADTSIGAPPWNGLAGPALSASGLDTIDFQFAPNPGEPPRPLRAIASSGEMARVMLALKTVLAAEDDVPVLVFDEVDANVGGETAVAVGQKMRQIARNHQVLCITHLAPVAAHGDAHYVVTKQLKDGRTISEIDRLDKRARIDELARMLGGVTDAARRHAEELLG